MKKKQKIVHLTYDMRIGGTETVIKNLVEGIDETRFVPEVLCIEPSLGPFGKHLRDQGVKITNLHWQSGFDIRLIKSIRAYIKANHVDVLHCHQYTPWVYGTLSALFTETKVIFTEHGRFYPDSSSWKRKFINPILIRFTSAITAISKATKNALTEFEFIPESHVKVIYNGIAALEMDEHKKNYLLKELNIPVGAKVVGTVARLDPIKNQTLMIKAFANALKTYPNVYLIIVGDGEERERLEALTKELSIQDNVRFTGYVAKPVNHIAIMDIFLLSSLSEGTSMTLLEAMSLSKPCLVTDAGGNAEVILNNFNGLVVENNSVEDFSKGLIKLLSNENTDFIKNAKDRFEQNFSQQTMNKLFEDVYTS